jgi:hypothetical protein
MSLLCHTIDFPGVIERAIALGEGIDRLLDHLAAVVSLSHGRPKARSAATPHP